MKDEVGEEKEEEEGGTIETGEGETKGDKELSGSGESTPKAETEEGGAHEARERIHWGKPL